MLVMLRPLVSYILSGGLAFVLIDEKMPNDLLSLVVCLFGGLYQLSSIGYLPNSQQLFLSGSLRMILYFSDPAVKMTINPITERLDIKDRGSFRQSK
jgi:hypothetical protein